MNHAASRPLAALVLFLSLFTTVGCGGSSQIRGRVVEGDIGVVAVVESKDARLKDPGIPNVAIELRASNGSTSRSLAEGKSGADGSFRLPLSSGQSLSEQLRLSAKAPGYVPTQGVTFIPGEGRELIIVLKRSDGGQTPSGSTDGKKPPTDHR